MSDCRATMTGAAATVVMTAMFMSVAGPASAGTLETLTGAIDAHRAGTQCPPLQLDSVAVQTAELANRETVDYIAHRSPVVPFTDPMPAMKTFGYPGSKAILLSGYAATESEAIHGLMVQARATKVMADCSYTQYGVAVGQERGYLSTTLVVAGQ